MMLKAPFDLATVQPDPPALRKSYHSEHWQPEQWISYLRYQLALLRKQRPHNYAGLRRLYLHGLRVQRYRSYGWILVSPSVAFEVADVTKV